ncbi:glycosyltransferase [Cryobacterium sp. Sr8]|uniref:glycosyltransferase n=1 Tax=Cryobacterium sp. Sr8 TaxID=1259203 RepID=UPI00106A4230|nr:glycosyltransferase [Cryobacterium sp. Sr8]TFD81600.1 glycosyltransferase [Cryobacterium sp. Sr8]
MTNTDLPLGYICLAVYKPNEELLRVQIESIVRQTESRWHCLVGIDGADPATEAVLRAALEADPRFTILGFEERVGFYRNFERILAQVPAEAPWVTLADQDDDWRPDKLALLIPRLQESSLVLGQAHVRRHGANSVGDAPPVVTSRRAVGLAAMMIDNQVTGSLAVFRGGLLRAALPFPEACDLAFHDHWLAICATLEDGVGVVGDVVQDYVQHDANVIGESAGEGLGERLRRLSAATAQPGWGARLDYISKHRWGWRVSMARTALDRFPLLTNSQARDLGVYASNQFSIRLLLTMTIECLARRVPPARSLALAVGSLRAPSLDRAEARRAVS